MSMTYSYTAQNECPMCGSPEQKVVGRRLNQHQGLRPRRLTAIATTIVQCRECGLMFPNPLPLPARIEDHYDRPPEDYWKAGYFGHDDDFAYHDPIIKRLRPDLAAAKCLDIGSGIGHLMLSMTARGHDAYGIEPSPAFRDRAIERGVSPDRVQLATADTANFPDDSFDFISYGAVLEHVPDPGRALAHSFKWLRPSGLLFVEVPASDWLVARGANLMYRLLGTDYVTNLSPMHPPYHLSEFTIEAFRRHGARQGYEIVEYARPTCDPILPGIAGRAAHWLMDRTQTGMMLQVWLTRN